MTASLCLARLSLDDLLAQTLAQPFLHPDERDYYDSLPQSPRRESYLIGRYCAKRALVGRLPNTAMDAMPVYPGVFGQPVLGSAQCAGLQISLTHCNGVGAAIAFDERQPMAIDMERVSPLASPRQTEAIKAQLTNAEIAMLDYFGRDSQDCSGTWIWTWIWTAKEALSKVLRTGLMIPMPLLEISRAWHEGPYLLAEYVHFPQYKVMSFLWRGTVVSIVLPKRTTLRMDFDGLMALP